MEAVTILNGIFQSLYEWHYALFVNCLSFIANAFIQLMTTDIEFFEKYAPAVITMYDVFTAAGWALLLGNLVFQAMKSMMAGLGFEAEDPATLLIRTGVWGLLLLLSRQILNIGLDLGSGIINLMGIPSFIFITMPDANIFFSLGEYSWVLVIIIGLLIGWQLIKMFFVIGERYVVVCVLMLVAPLGFALGGSKATQDLAKGFIRMYASMVLMMILNVMFLKLILSVLGTTPTEVTIIPWTILIVALAKMAQKADGMVARIGLNPVITGESLPGRGGAMALMVLAARTAINKSVSEAKTSNFSKSGSTANKSSGKNINSGCNSNNIQGGTAVNNQSLNNANSSQNASQTANSNANGQKPLFGSQRSAINGNINNNANQGGRNMNSNQSKVPEKTLMSASTPTPVTSPTRINTNRFGSSNSSGSNTSVNAANSSNSANSANIQKSAQVNSVSAGQSAVTPVSLQSSTVNQGKNNKAQKIADSLKTSGGNQGIVNNGKNNSSAAIVKDGKNSPNVTSVGNGKNNSVPAGQTKNSQTNVKHGKNMPPQFPKPVKNSQTSAINGKNDVEPVSVKSETPEIITDSKEKSNE